MTKDYYRILGVLDDAEDVVIRASYRALAQKYHPDKWSGAKDEANKKMADINEAFNILSDVQKRRVYDASRVKTEYQDESDENPLNESIEDDWISSIEYFPNLNSLAKNLSKISKELEYSFKVLVLDGKKFNSAEKIAKELEEKFLQKYFGTNKEIIEFAKNLINSKNRLAAKELNKAINLLGPSVHSSIIINKIKDKFQIDDYEHSKTVKTNPNQRLTDAANAFMKIKSIRNALVLLNDSGRDISREGIFGNGKFKITHEGHTQTLFENELLEYVQNIAVEILKN